MNEFEYVLKCLAIGLVATALGLVIALFLYVMGTAIGHGAENYLYVLLGVITLFGCFMTVTNQ